MKDKFSKRNARYDLVHVFYVMNVVKKSQKAKARSGIPMAYIPSTIRCSVYRRTQRAVLRLMKSEIKECETVM